MSRRKTSNSGILFVVSAPSGAGKTTVVGRLLKEDRELRRTISHTTRTPRPRERNGKDYYFISKSQFRRMIRQKGFVEWAEVYGNYYGTSKATIRKSLAGGHDVVLVIENQGALAIRKHFKNAVFILILPPSLKELKRRMVMRGGASKTELAKRLRAARREITSMRWYTYGVVNDRLSNAVSALAAIVQAERQKLSRQVMAQPA